MFQMIFVAYAEKTISLVYIYGFNKDLQRQDSGLSLFTKF